MLRIKVVITLVLLVMITSCTHLNPEINVNKEAVINVKTSTIIDKALSNGFTIYTKNTDNKDYLVLNLEERSDISMKIYASSQFVKANGVIITILIDKDTINNTEDNYKRPINDETLGIIKQSLSSLPCNDQKDFLKSGFKCHGYYNVQYKIYNDPFNGIRELLGITKNQQLLISIVP